MVAKELSDSLAGAVAGVSDSVVRVNGRRRSSTGIVWSASGDVLTALHTLQREEGLSITLPDGRELPAKVVGVDPGTDIALLRVDAELKVPTWSETGGGRIGELVLVLSRSGNLRATLGMVASTNGPWRTASGGRVDRWIDVDASLPPGGSGGPLVSVEGAVIGMNTSALSRGGGTVPVATLRRVAESIVAHGGVRRGWLGIGVQATALDGKRATQAGQGSGLLVVSLLSEGPAAKAGIQVGDILVSFGGQPLADVGDLHERLDENTVGTTASVRFLRGDEPRDVDATVAGKVARAQGRCGR